MFRKCFPGRVAQDAVMVSCKLYLSGGVEVVCFYKRTGDSTAASPQGLRHGIFALTKRNYHALDDRIFIPELLRTPDLLIRKSFNTRGCDRLDVKVPV